MRKFAGILLLLLLITQVSGCWDYIDLEDQSLPIVATYDIPEKVSPAGEQYQRIVLGTLAPNRRKPTMEKERISVTSAPTIGMSREERVWEFTAHYNPALVQTVVFSENLARQGLEASVDIVLRSPKIKNAIPIGIVEGKASGLLDINVEQIAPNIGQYLLQLLNYTEKRGFVVSSTIHQFNVNSLTPGKNPVAPTIRAIDNKKISITGTAIFDRKKMIAKVGKPETRTLILLRGMKSGGYVPYSLQRNGQLERGTVYLNNRRSVKVERQDDQYTFNITIKMKGYIVDKVGRASLLKDKDGIPKVEETVSAYLESDCRQLIEKMQNEFEVDCIDISKYAMAKWRNELEGKDDRDFIKNADIKVKVEVKLDNFGETT